MFEQKRAYWRNLDNAGKMFSAASTSKDTRVFRFYCVLKEQVDESILQEALNKTIKKYPIFLSVMRKGLFWHYLEKSELRPVVRKEYKEPCSRLYVRDKKALLFEITYYKKRINLEIFHALTDGTGATHFLSELVKNYLYLAHAKEGLEDVELMQEKISIRNQESDSFSKYYDPKTKIGRRKRAHAFQIKKIQKEYEELQVSEATVSAKALLKAAKDRGVSLTVLITAAFICAIHKEMSKAQERKPVTLMVPVNLRKIFPSESMLNFFGYIDPGHKFGEGKDSFEEIVQEMKQYFEENLTKDEIARRMNELIAFEKHKILRWAPLDLKNVCLRASSKMAEREVTAVFSNMGMVKLPKEYEDLIERFGVYTSTPRTEVCVCSFKDILYFGFTSRYDSTNIQKNFYKILTELGVEVTKLDSDFPEDAKPNYEGKKFIKGLSFACLASVIITGTANALFLPDMHWTMLAAAGILSMWVALMIGYLKRHNLMKTIMWETLIVTLGAVLWDWSMGWYGWSVAWVLPIAAILAQLSMLLVSKIQSHTAREYMIYYVMATLYGSVLPMLLMALNIIVFRKAAILSIGLSVLFLTGIVIFKGREFKEELYKKLHI